MKYSIEVSKTETININDIQKIIPENYLLQAENDHNLLTISDLNSGDESHCVYLNALREFDRISFLTGVNFKLSLPKTLHDDGSITSTQSISANGHIVAPKRLEGVGRQNWEGNVSDKLDIQLCLWMLAESHEHLAVKIILLFQIIETSYPDINCKKYTDSTLDPEPKVEAKFLRHLASHGNIVVHGSGLKEYCKRHQIPELMHNPNSQKLLKLFNERINIVRDEAREVIDSKITKISEKID